VAGGPGASPHLKNSLMRSGGGALWSPVGGWQRAGGLATFPQQRRWETPAGGQPSHAPGRPLPSANPGTMRARAIQAFQPNLAIEIQGFNPNAVPWAAGRGREGRGMPFPHPTGLPLSLQALRTAGCSAVVWIRADRRTRLSHGRRQKAALRGGAELVPRLAAPVLAKLGWCSQTPSTSCSRDSPEGQESASGGPRAPYATAPSPSSHRGHSPPGSTLREFYPEKSPQPKPAPGLSGFTLPKGCGHQRRSKPARFAKRSQASRNRGQSRTREPHRPRTPFRTGSSEVALQAWVGWWSGGFPPCQAS